MTTIVRPWFPRSLDQWNQPILETRHWSNYTALSAWHWMAINADDEKFLISRRIPQRGWCVSMIPYTEEQQKDPRAQPCMLNEPRIQLDTIVRFMCRPKQAGAIPYGWVAPKRMEMVTPFEAAQVLRLSISAP